MSYHVNPQTGEPGKCTAEIQCRFGSDADHYTDEVSARQAFEQSQSLTDVLKGAKSNSENPYARLQSQSAHEMSRFTEPTSIGDSGHTVRFENGRAITHYKNPGTDKFEDIPLGDLTQDSETVVSLITSDPDLDFINGDCGDLAWDLYDNCDDVEVVAQVWVKGDYASMHSIAKLKDGTYIDVLGHWSESEVLDTWKNLIDDDVEMRFDNPKPTRRPTEKGGLFEATRILSKYASNL